MADVILPGQTIGILGGGQLGRMFAISARRMGYRVHAFDPTRDCPTGQVADAETNAAYDDLDAARAFAAGVDVVTFEFENIPAATLAAIEKVRPVHPSPYALDTTRHRLREKEFLASNGFPVTPYRAVRSAADVARAAGELGVPCVLKTAEFGYDGKGQSVLSSVADAEAAWHSLAAPVGVLEAFVRFEREISVIVARGQNGDARVYEPFENVHRKHVLHTTVCPAAVPAENRAAALQLARAIADKLEIVGVLCVEMFVKAGTVIVNELAPRPHNSGHLTMDAAATCQFEQQVRAVCGLPLGDPTLRTPAAMVNLLGDAWQHGPPDWVAALKIPSVKLHLYGKTDPNAGRKMGHLTATGATVEEALQRATSAFSAVGPPGDRRAK